MSDLAVAAQPVLFGLRCGDPHHPEVGTVYGTWLAEKLSLQLAGGVPCYERVRSTDGGKTWARAEQ